MTQQDEDLVFIQLQVNTINSSQTRVIFLHQPSHFHEAILALEHRHLWHNRLIPVSLHILSLELHSLLNQLVDLSLI